MQLQHLFQLEMDNYPLEYLVSHKARFKYYKISDSKLPKIIKNQIKSSDNEGYALDFNGDRIIKNKDAAGKPRYKTINGQSIWNGSIQTFDRARLSSYLKDFFTFAIGMKQIKPVLFNPSVSLYLVYQFHHPISKKAQDAINHYYPYGKCFEDALVYNNILPDDYPQFLKGSAYEYVPVKHIEERKLVINAYLVPINKPIIQL